MSQPWTLNCQVPLPGELDPELNEFWVGNPWEIFRHNNLSAFERNRLFLNADGRNFLDASFLSAADTDADSRAVVAADFNHDGRLDLVVRQVGGGPLVLYENQSPAARSLQVTLRGRSGNRLGVGARLTASVGGRDIVRDLFPANTYRSQWPSRVHFGLGDAERVDRLTVRWPSGDEQVLHDLPVDRHIVIEQGNSQFATVTPGERIPP
ncbi:MAG TPA: CRTAC1 family protein [Planctomycetaceae bacterium]|nr:CRTAC1 family protein [Planctomycetaceae bacterium]